MVLLLSLTCQRNEFTLVLHMFNNKGGKFSNLTPAPVPITKNSKFQNLAGFLKHPSQLTKTRNFKNLKFENGPEVELVYKKRISSSSFHYPVFAVLVLLLLVPTSSQQTCCIGAPSAEREKRHPSLVFNASATSYTAAEKRFGSPPRED